MSLLQTLMLELQDRLQPEQPQPSAGDVADEAASERLNVTLPGGVMNRLKQQALAERRSCSSLATFLIEDGLRRHDPLS
ncbi:MAG: CopG family transcriptional regulator [Prochlorococcus sp.]|nr:CopG family transcriptional regulator [Prochlorococcaceae cyanobacterium Fu_MAG_50]